MGAAENIVVCNGCPRRQQTGQITVACSIDGKSIIDHAKENACPHPDGDRYQRVLVKLTATRPPERISDDHDPEKERRRMQQGGCCG